MRGAILIFLLASTGFGYIRQTTGSTPLVRSDNAGIQFYLNNGVVAGATSTITGSTVTVIAGDSNPVQAIRGALATWNRSGANVNFMSLKSTASVINGSDNQMTIAIGSTASDVSAVGGALAVTIDTFSPANGVILDSDIIINPADCFTTTSQSGNCTYDFQSTMTHELGHSLGLNHTGLLGSVMFQYNTLTERSLSSDELDFVYVVYPPANPPGFGTISGTITAVGGAPEPFALITMADPAEAGLLPGSYSALADASGNYSLKVPPGSYQVYAEPLNGVVQAGNLYLTVAQANQTQSFMATRFNGAVSVGVNTTSTVNISVTGGANSFAVPYVGVTLQNGSINGVNFYSGGPTFVASGQKVDLLLGGTGFDNTLTDANFSILGSAITVVPGSVRVDPNGSTVGPYKILRVTLDIPAQQGLSLASIFVSKGVVKAPNTLSLSGALTIGPPTPTTTSASVVNAASYAGNGGGSGAVSPGGLYALFDIPGVPNLGPASAVGNAGFDPYGFEAATLAGVTVTFDGVPAPLVFVAGSQINLQVPFEVAGKASTRVVVNYLGSLSSAVTVPVLAEQPAMISVDSTGTGPVAAVNQDGTINSAAHPAPQGTVVTIYGTGVGQQPGYTPFATGAAAPGVPGGFTGNYTYSIAGSASAAAAYVGPTPTSVGLAQFNLKIPTTSGTSLGGAVSVVVTSPNGVSSRAGTTIYVAGVS